MSEPIKWGELSQDQRNELVATKVMGWTPGTCDGSWGEQSNSSDGWFCLECGYEGYWGDDFKHEKIPPCYTTSMNAAWQVVERFQMVEVRKWVETDRYKSTPYSCSIAHNGETYSTWGATPMEAICLAGLEAVGIEVED